MTTEIIGYTRRQCEYPDCVRLGRNKGFYKGNTRYDKYCTFHHKMRYGGLDRFGTLFGKSNIPNDRCGQCGWNKAPCDRHRLNPKLGYTKENVLVLCPNCHREIEHNKLISKNA